MIDVRDFKSSNNNSRVVLSAKHIYRCGLVVLTTALFSCSLLTTKLETPNISVTKLDVREIGLLEQRYDVSLRVQNPNTVELPIKGLSFDIFLNGNKFAHGVSNGAVIVPAFGEQQIKVQIVSSLYSIINQIKVLSTPGSERLSYRIIGQVSLSDYYSTLEFDQRGTIGIADESKP